MDIRQELAAAYRLIAHFGLDDSIFTHISAKAPEGDDLFLINAYGLRFDEVCAGNLVTVNLDGEVIDDPHGSGINRAGFVIHSAVHAARPDVHCVLHTHTVAGVAVACQNDGLLPLNQWSLQFHNAIAYHEFEGIAVNLAERERLVADLGPHDVMVLRNHGMLTCGGTVGEAFGLMYNLERSCRAQLTLQASGAAIHTVPDQIRDLTATQYRDWTRRAKASLGTDAEWEAYMRLALKHYPDLAN